MLKLTSPPKVAGYDFDADVIRRSKRVFEIIGENTEAIIGMNRSSQEAALLAQAAWVTTLAAKLNGVAYVALQQVFPGDISEEQCAEWKDVLMLHVDLLRRKNDA